MPTTAQQHQKTIKQILRVRARVNRTKARSVEGGVVAALLHVVLEPYVPHMHSVTYVLFSIRDKILPWCLAGHVKSNNGTAGWQESEWKSEESQRNGVGDAHFVLQPSTL